MDIVTHHLATLCICQEEVVQVVSLQPHFQEELTQEQV
jgi:hypothetical protein